MCSYLSIYYNIAYMATRTYKTIYDSMVLQSIIALQYRDNASI